MSKSTKVLFIFAILLLIYGYLCRLLSIYFFWDSKYFGWLGILSALLLLLIDIRIIRLRQNQNIFFVRFFVAIIILILALEAGAIVWLKTTIAYDQVTESIEKDEVMKAEIGDFRGFSLIPGINIIEIVSAPSSETLTFVLTVRGQKTYKEMEIMIGRTSPLGWQVLSMRSI